MIGGQELLLDIVHEIAVLLVENCEERHSTWLPLVRGGWFRFPLMIKFGRILIKTFCERREVDIKDENYMIEHELDRELVKKLSDVMIGDVTDLGTIGGIAAVTLTLVFPSFTTRLIYVRTNDVRSCLISDYLNSSNLSHDDSRTSCVDSWWGDQYSSTVESAILILMSGSFILALLAVVSTIVVHRVVRKMGQITDLFLFLKNDYMNLVRPKFLVIISLAMLTSSVPLSVGYTQGQRHFVICTSVFSTIFLLYIIHFFCLRRQEQRNLDLECLESAKHFFRFLSETNRADYILGSTLQALSTTRHLKGCVLSSLDEARTSMAKMPRRTDGPPDSPFSLTLSYCLWLVGPLVAMPCLHRLYLRGWSEGRSFALRFASLNYLLLGWASDGCTMPELLAAAAAAAHSRSAACTQAADADAAEPLARAHPAESGWVAAGPSVPAAAATPVTPFTG